MKNIQSALSLAAAYISRLPEGCPWSLSADEGSSDEEPVDLEIAARTKEEFYQVGHILNCMPPEPTEVIKHVGSLEVCLFLQRPKRRRSVLDAPTVN